MIDNAGMDDNALQTPLPWSLLTNHLPSQSSPRSDDAMLRLASLLHSHGVRCDGMGHSFTMHLVQQSSRVLKRWFAPPHIRHSMPADWLSERWEGDPAPECSPAWQAVGASAAAPEGHIFQANRDQESVVRHELRDVVARYVRLRPTQWQRHISMRWEVESEPLAMESTETGMAVATSKPPVAMVAHLSRGQVVPGSQFDAAHSIRGCALRSGVSPGQLSNAWCVKDHTLYNWILVDLGQTRRVIAVATQGRGGAGGADTCSQHVQAYRIETLQQSKAGASRTLTEVAEYLTRAHSHGLSRVVPHSERVRTLRAIDLASSWWHSACSPVVSSLLSTHLLLDLTPIVLSYLSPPPSAEFNEQLTGERGKVAQMAGITQHSESGQLLQQLLGMMEQRGRPEDEVATLRHAMRLLQDEGEHSALERMALRSADQLSRI